jgi:hypothetical protein
MLHVHCGSASADSLRRSGVPGEVIEWADLLYVGPLPVGVTAERWRVVRADALVKASRGQLGLEQCMRRLEHQDQVLAAYGEHDEVVLWFDACLYDQLILIRHLDFFAQRDMGCTALSLVCVSGFPHVGRFRGLGQLRPEQLAQLFPTRFEVSEKEKRLGALAWAAVRSPDPAAIERLLAYGTEPPPYLADALVRFLQQYPSTANGLTRLENTVLAAIAAGHSSLRAIVGAVNEREERPFRGDTAIWMTVADLAECEPPLVRVDGCGDLPLWNVPDELNSWKAGVTELGYTVLAGQCDTVDVHGIDRWIGGVHLHGPDAQWRWDEHSGSLRATQSDS